MPRGLRWLHCRNSSPGQKGRVQNLVLTSRLIQSGRRKRTTVCILQAPKRESPHRPFPGKQFLESLPTVFAHQWRLRPGVARFFLWCVACGLRLFDQKQGLGLARQLFHSPIKWRPVQQKGWCCRLFRPRLKRLKLRSHPAASSHSYRKGFGVGCWLAVRSIRSK